MNAKLTPTLLLIMDGFGLAPAGPGNAVSLAATPNFDRLTASCPNSRLEASGRDVGLPAGYIGNSEVGHLNIGSGRIIYQDMTKIDVAIEEGELDKNKVFNALLDKISAAGGRLHLAGLISNGGVHSHIEHVKHLARIAAGRGLEVVVHALMDGRDTSPDSGAGFINELLGYFESAGLAGKCRVGTVCGRYYAMDRDTRWERVAEAFNMLVHGVGEKAASAPAAVAASYQAGLTDEFIKPHIIEAAAGQKPANLADGDGIFFFNFRADRMREIVRALSKDDFSSFERGTMPRLAAMASMTAYDSDFDLPVAFPKEAPHMVLGEVVSKMGLKQLRLAETEKYAHVTYFFNGGLEEPFEGEDRILVQSPRDVATYDLKPQMSAKEVTEDFLKAWKSGQYTLVVCNLANCDMVGHSGKIPATIKAVETVDACLGRMEKAVRESGGRMIVIADHGNAEKMLDDNGHPQTAHTTNPVPCILVNEGEVKNLASGRLADVAPTILGLWGVEKPELMTGVNLAGQ